MLIQSNCKLTPTIDKIHVWWYIIGISDSSGLEFCEYRLYRQNPSQLHWSVLSSDKMVKNVYNMK